MTASQHLQRLLDLGLADLTAVSDATLARHASALPHLSLIHISEPPRPY